MIQIRKSDTRGHANHGWWIPASPFPSPNISTRNTSSPHPARDERDRIAGGGGFPTHPHRDMEIVTYVLDGELAQQSSRATFVIKPGDGEYMSAGTGVAHSEFNASDKVPVHMYQIWMFPDKQGHTPAYDQKHFSARKSREKLRLVVSPDGRDGSVKVPPGQ